MSRGNEERPFADVGKRLRLARKSKGFNMEFVASKVGITRQGYSNWESGRSSPNSLQLRTLSEVLNVTVDWLVGASVHGGPVTLEMDAVAQAGYGGPLAIEERYRKEFEALIERMREDYRRGLPSDEE